MNSKKFNRKCWQNALKYRRFDRFLDKKRLILLEKYGFRHINGVRLLSDVGPLQIGSAKRGQQLTLSLSEKMLNLHMSDKNTCKNIAKALNSSYYHHGYAVGRKYRIKNRNS